MLKCQCLNTVKVHFSLISPSSHCLVAPSKRWLKGPGYVYLLTVLPETRGFPRFCRRGERAGRSGKMLLRAKTGSSLCHFYLLPLARTLSHGPKLPARDDGKCGLMCALEEDGVVRVLLCLCHLSTGFSEGDANVFRGRGDTVSVSSMPGQDNVQLT